MAWTADIDWVDGETITEAKLDQLTQNVEYVYDYKVPSGGIILWSGAVGSIPTGWYLCDGNNGTPNLTDRFVIGAGSTYSVNGTGGSVTKDISHTHTYSGSTGDESDTKSVTDDGDDQTTIADDNHHHHFSGTTARGGSSALNIMPPYYALCYIMKS